MELLHTDLFGPVAYLSIGGSKYGLVIVDDFSRFTWVFFLQDKSETQGTLKRFLRRAQKEFELKVKKIRSDNGSEYKNLHKLLKGEHVLGLTNVNFEKDRPCAACQAGKQVGNAHHSKNVMTTSRPLELLHMDLFGPVLSEYRRK